MPEITKSYADLEFHRTISTLIKKHSENKADIRAIAMGLIDWGRVGKMLDLGCGYGWFEEGLASRLEFIHGVDYLEENGQSFLKVAGAISERARFDKLLLPSRIDAPDQSFDFVLSAYSLYFFPGVLGEIKRLLKTDGVFMAITHSQKMMEEGQKFFDFKNLRKIIRNFSAENGRAILRQYFSDVKEFDYLNALVFTAESSDDLSRYIEFKREFISKDVDPEKVRQTMLSKLQKKGLLRFNKDDRIFLARK